jgi:hypothetical protein
VGGNVQLSFYKYQIFGCWLPFCFSARLLILRRQAARVPKKVPAAVNTQIVMVTALSLVVNMVWLPVETKWHCHHCSTDLTWLS